MKLAKVLNIAFESGIASFVENIEAVILEEIKEENNSNNNSFNSSFN